MNKGTSAAFGLVSAGIALAATSVRAGQVHTVPKPHVVRVHVPQRSVVRLPHTPRPVRIAPKPHVIVTKSVTYGPTKITVSASTPIRTGPSDAAPIIKRVPAGTPIPNILGEQNGFYEYVRYTNQRAWVAAADLQGGGGAQSALPIAPPPVAKPPTASKSEGSRHRWGTSVAASSPILEAPSADAKVIKTIPAGTHVPDIIGEQNGYYQYVRWTHKIAYIAVAYVRLGDGRDTMAAAPGDEAAGH